MNSIICTIRLLEIPKVKFCSKNIPFIECRVEVSPGRNQQIKKTVKIEMWGNIVYDLKNYYYLNDFLIIEGYFSNYKLSDNLNSKQTFIKLNILRFYPFLIKSKI